MAATTTAVALGRIALAALLDASPTARSRSSALAVTGVTAAGWLIERNKLQSRRLGKEARSAVRMKDVLVTGSVLASLAALADEKFAASASRAFTVAAVGATPFINFALFEDYRPHPVRSLFSL